MSEVPMQILLAIMRELNGPDHSILLVTPERYTVEEHSDLLAIL